MACYYLHMYQLIIISTTAIMLQSPSVTVEPVDNAKQSLQWALGQLNTSRYSATIDDFLVDDLSRLSNSDDCKYYFPPTEGGTFVGDSVI